MSGEVTIDLSNYKDRVGQRIAPGRYRVTVEDAEQDTAKSGNTMINVWLRVLDGDFAGSVVIDRLVLHENSLFRVVGFMTAVGIPTPKKRFRLQVQSLVGRVLEVDIEDGDPYNGRIKSEVRGYYRAAKQEGGTDALSDLDTFVDPERNADSGNGNGNGHQGDLIDGLAQGDEAFPEGAVDLDTLEI